MLRKDYILRVVEELARFLAKALGLLKEGKPEEAEKWVKKGYKLLQADQGRILALPPAELVVELERKQGFDFTQMELIADLIRVEGEIKLARDEPDAAPLFVKALALYEYIDKNHTVYSFERSEKILRLHELLEDE